MIYEEDEFERWFDKHLEELGMGLFDDMHKGVNKGKRGDQLASQEAAVLDSTTVDHKTTPGESSSSASPSDFTHQSNIVHKKSGDYDGNIN